MMDWILTVVVSVLLANHHVKDVHTYRMEYATRYTCEDAQERLDRPLIAKWYGKGHKTKRALPGSERVVADCARVGAYDKDADSDWWDSLHHPYISNVSVNYAGQNLVK